MRAWNGQGTFQWEHVRQWGVVAGASSFPRAEGAVLVPGGLSTFSLFFRRQAQSGSTFELYLWTAPVYFKPLDQDIDATTAPQHLLKLELDLGGGATGIVMTGTTTQVFGARLKGNQPMGSLLFWELKNAGVADATIVGDLYLVPSSFGMIAGATFARPLEVETACMTPSLGRTLRGGGR